MPKLRAAILGYGRSGSSMHAGALEHNNDAFDVVAVCDVDPKRQEQAKQFDDEDDRGRILDNMRTVFGALAAGEMLNFMDVMDDGHVNANAKADADEEAEEQADAA